MKQDQLSGERTSKRLTSDPRSIRMVPLAQQLFIPFRFRERLSLAFAKGYSLQ
jgi:hypothetical protein